MTDPTVSPPQHPLGRVAQVVSIARDTDKTLSETVAFLMRRGLGESRAAELTHSPATGLPVVRLGRMITTEDVRALEDD